MLTFVADQTPRALPRNRPAGHNAHPGWDGVSWVKVLRLWVMALVLLASSAVTAPAHALGESGPFTLPLVTSNLPVASRTVTRVPLRTLISPDAAEDIDFSTAALDADPAAPAEIAEVTEVSKDRTSVRISGQGTWTLLGEYLAFSPEEGSDLDHSSVALQISSVHGHSSTPQVLSAHAVKDYDVTERASAGVAVEVPLPLPTPDGARVRLQLEGQEAGAVLTSKADRLITHDQATWEVSPNQRYLTFTPLSARTPSRPLPVRYTVVGSDGLLIASGEVDVAVPLIPDLTGAGPYGKPITVTIGQNAESIDPATLKLNAPDGESAMDVSADRTRVDVPNQGTWQLDRATGSVTFTPVDKSVQFASPILISGQDGHGHYSGASLVTAAYPVMIDRTEVAQVGSTAVFSLATGAAQINAASVEFSPNNLPAGAQLSADRQQLTVPGEGIWSIDRDTATVTMSPESSKATDVSSVGITALGRHPGTSASASLSVRFVEILPTMRDDEARTTPESTVTIQPLANDTAGTVDRPLEPGTLRLRSLAATNLPELDQATGDRLVMPGEGIYTVGEDGRVTFDPAHGFVGRTTAVEYVVEDASGVPASALIRITVDPTFTDDAVTGPKSVATGINALVSGIMPSNRASSLSYITICSLLLWAGVASLWIGHRMGVDRREHDQ